MILLLFLALADPVADAQALADRDGVAAFDAILKAATEQQDYRVQAKMLDVLASFGGDALPRVLARIALSKPPPRVRECAFMTLQKIARRDDAIPMLIPLLVHTDRSVARVVSDGLKRETAIPALFAVLRGKDRKLQNQARAILRTFGAKLKPHLEPDPDAAVRVQLVPLYAAAGMLEELAKWVRDPDVKVRQQVVAEFGRQNVSVAVPVLTAALEDKDVRQSALVALAKLGEPGLPVLRKEMESKDVLRRQAAVRALGHGGAAALPLLIAALEDKALQAAALSALAPLGEAAAPAAPAVAKLVPDHKLSKLAVGVLGTMGTAALPTVLDLVPQLPPDTSFGILRRWGEKKVTRALATLLGEDKSAARRRAAAWALGRLGGAKAVPALVRALADKEPLVVSQSIWALGQIGPKAKAAVPALREKEKDAAHRAMARDALKRIEG